MQVTLVFSEKTMTQKGDQQSWARNLGEWTDWEISGFPVKMNLLAQHLKVIDSACLNLMQQWTRKSYSTRRQCSSTRGCFISIRMLSVKPQLNICCEQLIRHSSVFPAFWRISSFFLERESAWDRTCPDTGWFQPVQTLFLSFGWSNIKNCLKRATWKW